MDNTLNIIFNESNPTGIIECTLGTSNAIFYKIPRVSIKELSNFDFIKNTGNYVLYGENKAYVGKANHIDERIKNHNQNKNWWTECLAIVSKDDSINEGHISYVEDKLYRIGKKSKRYELDNDQNIGERKLAKSDRIIADRYISEFIVFNKVLGYHLFDEPLEKEIDNSNIYYLGPKKNPYASMVVVNNEFIVRKGSRLAGEINPKISIGLLKACKEERNSEDIVDGIYVKDHPYSNPTKPAYTIMGINEDGWIVWKNENGISLGEAIGREPRKIKQSKKTSKTK